MLYFCVFALKAVAPVALVLVILHLQCNHFLFFSVLSSSTSTAIFYMHSKTVTRSVVILFYAVLSLLF